MSPTADNIFSIPSMAVVDYSGALPIALQRHALEGTIPEALTRALSSDMELDFVAFCLACAPKSPYGINDSDPEHAEWYPFFSPSHWFFVPPNTGVGDIDLIDSDRLVWCHTDGEILPMMPAVVSALNFSSIVYQGSATQSLIPFYRPSFLKVRFPNVLHAYVKDHSDDFAFNFLNHPPCHFPLVTRLLRQVIANDMCEFGSVKSAWCLLVGNIAKWKAMNVFFGTDMTSLEVVEEDGGEGLYNFKGATIDSSVVEYLKVLRKLPLDAKMQVPSVLLVINLDDRSGPSGARSRIEETWLRVVGGRGLPFSGQKREELIEQVTSSNPRLASFYRSWRDFEPSYRASIRSQIRRA
jgi:hypothetical protein